ncbi:MAG: large subunit ribosomal protein [Thermoplasmata archaeon]|jgi:large subunit ribosomal protein L11|nr:large subunit ribosomal protein [Thermoplasmata archaeon]
MAQTIETVVDGGKANAGPLGPVLGPAGVNMGKVVAEINLKTKDYAGMKVPVKIVIDDKKNFVVEVGTPPVSQLVLSKAKIEKGAGTPNKATVGNLTIKQCIEITRMKGDTMLGANLKKRVKEVVGTCVSMGVTIEGRSAKEMSKAIEAGEFDGQLKE